MWLTPSEVVRNDGEAGVAKCQKVIQDDLYHKTQAGVIIIKTLPEQIVDNVEIIAI